MAAMMAQHTGETPIILLTLDHPSWAAPERLSWDKVDTYSRGQTYVAYPFDVILPDDIEDGTPQAKITIDNVSREIWQRIAGLQTAPLLTIEMVLASAPDDVEFAIPGLRMMEPSVDALQIEAVFGREDTSNEAFPKGRFTPAVAPGLF